MELWREVAQMEGLSPDVIEVPEDRLLASVASGEVDVAITAVASPEDEARVDFVLPYHVATLGVARPANAGFGSTSKRFLSSTVYRTMALTLVLLLVVGVAEWLFERRNDDTDFDKGPTGVWHGFYWAGVTMTTIGYGDKVPKTLGGQILALVWMIAALGLTSILTTALVSALGIGENGPVQLPDGVRGMTVGVEAGSDAEAFLQSERVRVLAFPSVARGLDALEADSVDTFVAGAPQLQNAVNEQGRSGLQVATTGVSPRQRAFAVAQGSALRESLSRAVLDRASGPEWQATLNRYVGAGG